MWQLILGNGLVLLAGFMWGRVFESRRNGRAIIITMVDRSEIEADQADIEIYKSN
jgi:hypothetical protein